MSRYLDRLAQQTPYVPAMIMVAMALLIISGSGLLPVAIAVFVVATAQLAFILSKRSQRP